ncbi:MAG TPA: TPM domain-containing protein, partial [Kofleriaceae bacterium]|nr:TPM domain-containing protein [Kofleriaceae bacterium]
MWRRAGLVPLALAVLAPAAEARTPLPARAGDRWIYDAAEVIDAGDESSMEAASTELFRKTGVAIAVITVARLDGETIDELAVRVGQDWGVGRKGQDRGLVIAFARDDRKIFVATGYGTEGYLPDGKVGALLDQYAVPDLRANRFSAGLRGIFEALASASAQEFGTELTGVRPPPPAPEKHGVGVGTVLLGFLGLLLLIYLSIRYPRFMWFMLSVLASSGRGR